MTYDDGYEDGYLWYSPQFPDSKEYMSGYRMGAYDYASYNEDEDEDESIYDNEEEFWYDFYEDDIW